MAIRPPEPKLPVQAANPSLRGRIRRATRAINPFLSASNLAELAKSKPLGQDANFNKEFVAVPLQPGYRQSQPINVNPFAFGSMPQNALGTFFLPKKEPQTIAIEDIWAGQWTPGGLVNILIDISPDVSQALWNNLRVTGTKALFKGTKLKGEDDPEGQELIEDALSKINPDSGGVDNFITLCALSLYVFGALATDSELEFGLTGTGDIFTVHPDTIWFQRDQVQKPVPYQLQYLPAIGIPAFNYSNPGLGTGLPFRRLNQAVFKYTPFDPTIDDPYGRGPFWPVLQVIFFLAQLLRDLQRVVENQAWPHTDLSVDSAELTKMMERIAPQNLNSPEQYTSFLEDQLFAISQQYNNLAVQDAYVHSSIVEVNQNTHGGQLFDVSKIVHIVRMQIVAAVKQLPIFMNLEGADSAESATQFEIYVHHIERVRDILSDHIIHHLQLNHWMHAHQGKIFSKWPEIRSTQRLQDAQAESVEAQTSAFMRDQGWIDQDQAAIRQTGTKAVNKTPDWEHLTPVAKRGPGDGPKGEDKDTSPNTVAGSTKSKNKREEEVLV